MKTALSKIAGSQPITSVGMIRGGNNSMTRLRTIFAGVLVICDLWFGCLSASAQDLQGRFYSEKQRYMVGEPVTFNLEIKNAGKQIVYLPAKGSAKCLDTYEFSVSGSGSACSATWDAGCYDVEAALGPGDVIHGQWPLDSWYRFEREGKYQVSITRHTPVRTSGGEVTDFTFSSRFEVHLDPTKHPAGF